MSVHTPGPWSAEDHGDEYLIVHIVRERPKLLGRVLARVRVSDLPSSGGGVIDAANAQLIAAAPDLLVAAKMALEALPIALRFALRPEDLPNNPNVEALRAAIAKAEGKAEEALNAAR